jgi:hypothetical protein
MKNNKDKTPLTFYVLFLILAVLIGYFAKMLIKNHYQLTMGHEDVRFKVVQSDVDFQQLRNRLTQEREEAANANPQPQQQVPAQGASCSQ